MRPSLRRVIGLDDSQLSGHKAYRTSDGPRTPRRHTREGDAAVPVCMWARALVCMVHAWLGAARHVGSHGRAAPGPFMVCWWAPGGGGVATFTLAASLFCVRSCTAPVLSPAPGVRGLVLVLPQPP